MIRHNPSWINDVSIVVIDEIHLLNDVTRGPTLEILITMLKKLVNPQIVALSATIGNAEELAEWLGAELVKDSWRPTKLYEGIAFKNEVDFFNEKKSFKISPEKDIIIGLVKDTINLNKQSFVFVNSKRGAESVAEKIAKSLEIEKGSVRSTLTNFTLELILPLM